MGFDDLTYYETLLRYVGCNAETDWLASIVSDELTFRTEYARIDTADANAVISPVVSFIRRANAG